MTKTTRWTTAILFLAVLMATACGATLPPIDIVLVPGQPTNSTPPAPQEPLKPVMRGTLAFQVVDDEDKPICLTLSLHTGELGYTNADGYVKWDGLELGPRHVIAHYSCTIDGVDQPDPNDPPEGREFNNFEFDARFDRIQFQQRVVIPRHKREQLHSLNIVVHDAAGAGIGMAACAANGETRKADGSGFINFAVRGPGAVTCEAPGYIGRTINLPPGDHRVGLIAIAPPKPVEPPKPTEPIGPPAMPPKAGVVPECGAMANNGRVSQACVDAVAKVSAFAKPCQVTGVAEPCHYFVREVATALKVAQSDARWGVIRKTRGGDNVEGYGVDVVAYLPEPFSLDEQTWRWRGADIIGCLGCKAFDGRESTLTGGTLHRVINCDTTPKEEIDAEGWCNRPQDVWAPVPVAK